MALAIWPTLLCTFIREQLIQSWSKMLSRRLKNGSKLLEPKSPQNSLLHQNIVNQRWWGGDFVCDIFMFSLWFCTPRILAIHVELSAHRSLANAIMTELVSCLTPFLALWNRAETMFSLTWKRSSSPNILMMFQDWQTRPSCMYLHRARFGSSFQNLVILKRVFFFFVFVKAGQKCGIHVAFHGCNQDIGSIGNVYAVNVKRKGGGKSYWAISQFLFCRLV